VTTHRERMLAALQGRPTDCIPFVPRLDLWYSANRCNSTLPDRYRNTTLLEIVVKVIVGDAPVTQKFANEISADAFAQDAAIAVERMAALISAPTNP